MQASKIIQVPFHYIQKRFRKPLRECWEPVCGLEIRKVPRTGAEKCRVAGFLGKHYFPDNPVFKAGGLSQGKVDAGILQYLLTGLNDDKALYALVQESQEILGVAIARTTTPTTSKELQILSERLGSDKARRYASLLSQIEFRTNLYETYKTNKVWSIDVLATNRTFRRRGIAKMLLQNMKDMAVKNSKYDVMRFVSTNIYGSAAARCGGMKPINRRSLQSYKDDDGVPWIKKEMCPPHSDVEVFIRNLKADKPPEPKKEPTCFKYGLEKHYV